MKQGFLGSEFSSAKTAVVPQEATTLMSKINPNTSFQVSINTQSLERTATQSVKDLPVVQQSASAAMDQLQDTRTAFIQEFSAAQGALMDFAKKVGPDLGINPDRIDATFAPQQQAGAMDVGGAVIGDALVGAGASSAYTVMGDIQSHIKGLDQNEIKALIEEMHTRIQTGQAQHVNIMNPKPALKPEHDGLANLNKADLKELMEASPEQQPELVQLDHQIEEVQNVQANHAYVDEHWLDHVSDQDMATLQEQGVNADILAQIVGDDNDVFDNRNEVSEVSYGIVNMTGESIKDMDGIRPQMGDVEFDGVYGVQEMLAGAAPEAPATKVLEFENTSPRQGTEAQY